MLDWKAAAKNGFRRWQEKRTEATKRAAEGDPAQWREFLASRKIAYTPHARAQTFLKDDFAAWRKGK